MSSVCDAAPDFCAAATGCGLLRSSWPKVPQALQIVCGLLAIEGFLFPRHPQDLTGGSVPVTLDFTIISTDITGTYLFAGEKAAVASGSKGAVAVYKIGPAAALTVVAGSPSTAGTGNPGVTATSVVS